jgi:hypothetical protein
VNPLLDPCALELRDACEDACDQSPGRGARVDPLSERNERDPAGLPLIEQQHQVAQVAPEPIEAPAEDCLNLVSPDICGELIECRPTILGATHCLVHVLDRLLASSLGIAPQLEGWSYAEAERRFETEHIPNCSITHYELEDGRLVLRDAGVVHWSTELSVGMGSPLSP